jgi:hypothetical protein
MPAFVEVQSGPSSGKRLEVQAGTTAQVGRHPRADLAVPQDEELSPLHFALTFDGRQCRLRDLRSRYGTFVNGARVTEAAVNPGDRIVAGRTTFGVVLVAEGAPAADVPAPPTEPSPEPAGGEASSSSAAPASVPVDGARVAAFLRRQRDPLFALLDAARDPKVLELLRPSGTEHQSLYEGFKGELLADFAPYLVRLPPESPFLDVLAREGWGRSWGSYLTSEAPFAEVRRQFRRFLMVKVEGGKELYFRYYDPRVLRVFLPTCTPEEAGDFFGPVRSFLIEAPDPAQLLRFTLGAPGLVREVSAL